MKRIVVSVAVAMLVAAWLSPAFCGTAVKWAPKVNPKPLSGNINKGLAWLAKTQMDNGAWGQGEESTAMGNSLDKIKDKPNLADTCMATLAFIRAGSTPSKGQYAATVRKAVTFVCAEVEESDQKSLYITNLRGTRTQQKLGTYIDTFMAAMLLADVKDQMPDAKSRNRSSAALKKVLSKMEKNQRSDGTWDKDGWAPVLSQSMATKALNRAAQKGATVDEGVRSKAETHARNQYDSKSGRFATAGSPGVALYSASGPMGAMQDSDNTNVQLERKAQDELKNAKTDKERNQAKATLKRVEDNRRDLQAAQKTVVSQLDNKQFMSGFGSNGGEEYLSYMNIGESLVVKGGPEWNKWDKQITGNLNRIQNTDGTWTGHHCITGRTFCTSAAILVLTTDRAPVPLSNDIKRR